MQFSQPESFSPSCTSRCTAPEQKRNDIGTLHDLDLKDDENSERVYQPRMVTAPLRLYQPRENQATEKRATDTLSDSKPTLYDKVFLSIRQGDEPKEISIPDHHVKRNIVFYRVVTANELLQWDSWIRYDDFASLHHRLGELAGSLDVKLPVLPAKFPKLLVNHLSTEFIKHRREGLERYLRRLNDNMLMRYSEDFISFLLPSRQAKADILEGKADGAGTWGSSEEDPPQERQRHQGTWGSSSEEAIGPSRACNSMLPLALLMPREKRCLHDPAS